MGKQRMYSSVLTAIVGSYSFVVADAKRVQDGGDVDVTQHAAPASPVNMKTRHSKIHGRGEGWQAWRAGECSSQASGMPKSRLTTPTAYSYLKKVLLITIKKYSFRLVSVRFTLF